MVVSSATMSAAVAMTASARPCRRGACVAGAARAAPASAPAGLMSGVSLAQARAGHAGWPPVARLARRGCSPRLAVRIVR
jgi:hypothetical protein